MASLCGIKCVNGNMDMAAMGSLCVTGMRTNYRQTVPERRPLVHAMNGQIEYYPGIPHEKPKHPDFALKSVRLSSFRDWGQVVLEPAQLAEAGFFYTGPRDCVKCFFCGGSMRDWVSDDNAWIEHANCFPHCEYVKLSKGKDCTMSESDLQEFRNNVDDQLIETLNSTSAKLVMNMGYNQEDVEDAIRHAFEKYGYTDIRAQYIQEYLLDNNSTCTKTFVGEKTAVSSDWSRAQEACEATSASAWQSEAIADDNKEYTEDHRQLLEENRSLKQKMMCKICMGRDACIVSVPCGHMVACGECALALRKCAVCRSVIQGTIRAYPA